MITLKTISRIAITLSAICLLSACVLPTSVDAQSSTTIHLPFVTNGDTFESLDSYRITHTSIYTHPASSSPEHLATTYEWERAENQYGFNSGLRLSLGDMSMHEIYLLDENAYGGMFNLVAPRPREEIQNDDLELTRSAIPLLTVNGEIDEGSLLGANGGLPVRISEIISQSQIIGSEIIHGVSTTHYQLDNAALLSNQIIFGADATISSAQGDFWIANDGEHVVRFVIDVEADNGATHHLEYLVNNINSLQQVALPATYQVEIDALRDGTNLPHPDCETCLFPIFPNAGWGYDSMTVGNGLIFVFPMNGMTESEMKAIYEQRLAELGWIVTTGEEWIASNETRDFSVRFEQLEDDGFKIWISFLPNYRE